MIATTCPSRETLFQYSVGTLYGEQRDALDEHLDCCPDCQATIMTLDDADDTVAGRLRTPPSSESFLAEPQLHEALAAAMEMPIPRSNAKGAGLEANLAPDMPETLGEYQLLEELGRGGMGRVYKALQTKLDRVVAVKVLPRGRVGDRQAINRFEREMKAVGRLAHPNIVQAYDAREIDDTPVLIMEFVDGLDLAEIVRRVGSLPVAEACELVRRTALALQCAHEHGLVHRDIKPSNIMLARSGEVKLLDLGLARFYAEGASISPLSGGEEMTGTGQAMGTADYMAPEQASDSRTVGIRADIYSLGCTLYKLLSGRAPFSGPEFRATLDKLNAHVHQPVPSIRTVAANVPEKLAAILDRMVAKDPGERFATPAEVAAALEPFCKRANLANLMVEAMARDKGFLSVQESARERADDFEGGNHPARQLTTAPVLRRPILWRILIGLGFLGAMTAGFAAGVIITIKKNNENYQLEVSKDSHVAVDEQGNATVTLPSRPKNAKTSGTTSAAAEVTAPQAQAGSMQSPGAPTRMGSGRAAVRGRGGVGRASMGGMDGGTGGMSGGGGGFVGGMQAPETQQGMGGGGFYGGVGGVSGGQGGLPGGIQAPGATAGMGGFGGGMGGSMGFGGGMRAADGTQAAGALPGGAPPGGMGGGARASAGMGGMGGGLGGMSMGMGGLGGGGSTTFSGVIQGMGGMMGGGMRLGGGGGGGLSDSTRAQGGMPGLAAPAVAAPPEVSVVHPIVRQFSHHMDFEGRLEAAQTAEVRVRVTGYLAKVLVKPGTMVKQGDLLFEIDPAPFQAEQDKREADVRLAQLRLNRTTAELKDSKAPSSTDRQRMEAQQAEAEAALMAAREGLKVAQLNMESTRLTAPIGGKIGRPLIAVGSLVSDGMTLATIDAVDPMCVVFDVDQHSVLKLRRDPPRVHGELALPVLVRLTDEKGYPRQSKVESADTRIDSATGIARWRALLPNPDGLLMPGMSVRVRLVTSDPYEAFLIPRSAEFVDQQHDDAFIVTDQNIVQRREIETGGWDDDGMRVVDKGLTADDWVIGNCWHVEVGRPMVPWKDGMTVKPLITPAAVLPASSKEPRSSSLRAPPATSGPPMGKTPDAARSLSAP
ncbi:MAG: efflux RND transporter periplasmic adaptor subunit [Thermoguttaceae bacterium]